MNGDAHQSSSLRRDDFSSARILANYLDREQETRCMVADEGRTRVEPKWRLRRSIKCGNAQFVYVGK
jgi:hypothetical protein